MYYEEFLSTVVENVFDDHDLGFEGPWCKAEHDYWLCTRRPHEPGMHEAVDATGHVCARWVDDPA